jgi:hypothetical protein
MEVWPDQHQTDRAARQSRFGNQAVAMRRSWPIEVDGLFLGAGVEHELGVRFIAVDVRVTEMDQSIWPNPDHAYRSVRQLFRSARAADPF